MPQKRARAPGPRGHPLIGNLIPFRRHVLQTLLDGRNQFGDMVRFTLGPFVYHLLAHPDQIEYVLRTNHWNYDKKTPSSAKIRDITGDGLLTSNGEFWVQQRRRWQPAFSPAQVATYLPAIVTATNEMLRRWERAASQREVIDVASEMMRVTCAIVAQVILGSDVRRDLPTIENSATLLMGHAWKRLQRLLDIPLLRFSSERRRLHEAARSLNDLVARIIEQRRQDKPDQPLDLLGQFLQSSNSKNEGRVTDEQLRCETITVLLAGHETTANALAWCWYCLANQPDVYDQVAREIQSLCGTQPPTLDDMRRLETTTRVFLETIRLYPPIWIMERRAIVADQILGYDVPRGSSIIVSPWVTHRHPAFWDRPESFDPERFSGDRFGSVTSRAYLPFGLGPRHCIGADLARMEAIVILTMVIQRYRLERVSLSDAVPQPGITLRIVGGLPMRVLPVAISSPH